MTDTRVKYVRASQIVGDRKKGIPPILPISRSYFWRLVSEGVIPQPIKFGPRVSMWKEEDIYRVLESMTKEVPA